MSDIVERLRAYHSPSWGSALADAHDAADEIERLRAEVERQQAEREKPVASYPADSVSLKQRKDGKLVLALLMNNCEPSQRYWVMRSDARGTCSTPGGCSLHGCHGECLTGAAPVTEDDLRAMLPDIIEKYYPNGGRWETKAVLALVELVALDLGRAIVRAAAAIGETK